MQEYEHVADFVGPSWAERNRPSPSAAGAYESPIKGEAERAHIERLGTVEAEISNA